MKHKILVFEKTSYDALILAYIKILKKCKGISTEQIDQIMDGVLNNVANPTLTNNYLILYDLKHHAFHAVD